MIAASPLVAASSARSILHVGCGPKGPRQLHSLFRDTTRWREIRLDVDPQVEPDIQCSTVDMRAHVPDASVDAVWSSHNMEHLFDHEVPLALAEFRRVLKPSGFVLIRCPDLTAILKAIEKTGLENPAYMSPAGPITPLDMLYGHRPSIARGNHYMAHHTAFTDMRLARLLMEAGFPEVRTRTDSGFDLWAVAFGPEADVGASLLEFMSHELSFLE
ncbi:MAG: methyltransferase domain-containing protein [Proteobacteria bacterium]|nr:methyltransferase domain-containing protein [Pseudomonadota bacterium]